MARNRYFEDEEVTYKFSGKSITKALRYALPHKKLIISMIVMMVIMSFVALIPPMLNSVIVDKVISKQGFWDLNWIECGVIVIMAWGLIGVSDVVYTFFRTYLMSRTGHNMVYDIRRDAYCHLQKLAFDYYDSRPAGKILVRVTSYLDELANIFSSAIIILVVEVVKVVLIFAWLFILDYRLALVVMAAIVPMGILVTLLRRVLARRHRIHRNKCSNRTAYIAESVQGVFVTKAFNRAALNTEIYDELNKECNKSWTRVIHFNEWFFPTLDGFFYIGLLAVYAVAIFMATTMTGMGGLSLGKLISFIMYMQMFSGPLNNIATVSQQLTKASSNLERVFEVMETPPSVTDAEDAYVLPEIDGEVKFEDVTFGYEKGRNILERFNLEVERGKMVALVGPTGAGKTTVINLLSRFYNVNSGRVLIDGHDIAKVNLHSLRTQVGVMMQDSFVFSGTIIDNIRYARPDATDEECINAAKEVGADIFIDRLHDGYYTKTSEQGAGLSTGERQLLSFARVVLTNPKILILDEATSSIDTHSEEIIKKALDKILKGRTSFVIAHRLSTIKKADCILYIANKGIAEAGTHEQLMELNGRYAALVRGE